MHNILLDIVKRKKQDLKGCSLEQIKQQVMQQVDTKQNKNNFSAAISKSKEMAIIAEIKLASPTNQSLGSEHTILERAAEYEHAGADAISFITEQHYFKGGISYIPKLKNTTNLPILQKDFIIDQYQIYESKLFNSDALLFIAKLLDKKTLQEFVQLSLKLHIEPVVEINDAEDLKKAIPTDTSIIAVNSRDLRTFEVDVDKACRLMQQIPDSFIKLGFSGINSADEVKKYAQAGANGVLVGTKLMQATNIYEFINNLKSYD